MSGHAPHVHADNPEHKRIGIFIAVLAVATAVIGSLAKMEVNRMIVKEVHSSNGFAWYQAKRQRSYMNELEIKRADFELAGNVTDAQRKILEETKSKLKAKNAEYEKENDEIRVKAETDKQIAEVAAHKQHNFEYAEIAMHIAMVLCSLTLLTESRMFLRLGAGVAAIGIALAIYAYAHNPAGGAHADSASMPASNTPAVHK